MKKIIIFTAIFIYPIYAQEPVANERNPLRLDFGVIAGKQSLSNGSNNAINNSYSTYYLSINEKVSEKSELSFALLYNKSESNKVSGEYLFIKYTNYFKYNWEFQTVFTPRNSNFLSKNSRGEIEEISGTTIESKFLLGYTLVNKKNYRLRFFAGGGYQLLAEMKSSVGGVEYDPGYKKKGGAMYELNPVLDVRGGNGLTYSLGLSHTGSGLKTDNLEDQNQKTNSISVGISFDF